MNKPDFIAKVLTALIVLSLLGFAFKDEVPLPEMSWPEWSLPEWSLPEWSFKSESKKKVKTKTSSRKKTAGNVKATHKVVDEFRGVKVYDNGSVRNVAGRNTTKDGYNLGLKYQCVEFVKRFYYEHLGHKMPNAYGHARELYNPSVKDGTKNRDRNLTQFSNPSASSPKRNDILVFGGAPYNNFGHVAIITAVESNRIQIIQQNPGPGNPSREWLPLKREGAGYRVTTPYVVGWLGIR